jgi:hypothetical protein
MTYLPIRFTKEPIFEHSEQEYNSMQNALDYAVREGFIEGLEQDKIEVVQGMLANGLDWNLIDKITHLCKADFEVLKTKHSKGL